MLLPKIYPITDTVLTGLSHTAQVEKLIAGGAKIIQLREKNLSPKEFLKDAEKALALARAHAVKLIINDRADIAFVLKADGVHLGQDDLPPSQARKILGEKAIIGFSTHNFEQISEAVKMPIDYVAVGPIFPTSTKENPDAVVGLDGLCGLRRAIGNFPLVAIGGINRQNVRRVFENGADSAAVISAVLTPPETIEENFAKFMTSDDLTEI